MSIAQLIIAALVSGAPSDRTEVSTSTSTLISLTDSTPERPVWRQFGFVTPLTTRRIMSDSGTTVGGFINRGAATSPDGLVVWRAYGGWNWGSVEMATPVPVTDSGGAGNVSFSLQMIAVDTPTYRLAVLLEAYLPSADGESRRVLALPRDLPSLGPRATTLGAGVLFQGVLGPTILSAAAGGYGGEVENDPVAPIGYGAGWVEGLFGLPLETGGLNSFAVTPFVEADVNVTASREGAITASTMTFGLSLGSMFDVSSLDFDKAVRFSVGSGYQLPIFDVGVTDLELSGRWIFVLDIGLVVAKPRLD